MRRRAPRPRGGPPGRTPTGPTGRRVAGRPSLPGGPVAWSIPGALVLPLILLGAFLLHRGALELPFFADDYIFLEQARGRPLAATLTTPDGLGNFFRPVGRQLHFWTLGRLSGESPWAFHAANLAAFLGIVALLFHLARRLAGRRAAAVAAGFLALHYAADVPLRWASGSQDLLAVLGALGAIALHLAGRRAWAAGALLLALLSKETVLLTPLMAAAADRARGTPWRRALVAAWPLAATVAVWAALWLVTLPLRPGFSGALGFEPLGAAAALAHLVQVVAGIEWRGAFTAVAPPAPPWLPLLAVALAVAAAFAASPDRAPAPDRAAGRAAAAAGGLWALAATVPLVAVAGIWSAYYYLFALCGAALAIGALAARGPGWLAVALVAALAAGSGSGRGAAEFATGRGVWTWQSHVNRRYVDRATERVGRYLADLRRARPSVAPRTTFFFSGLPAFLAWQTGDGPLVRWAYQDTSLRSYFQADFTLERARRGPVLFFNAGRDTLREEVTAPGEIRAAALRALLGDHVGTARDMLLWMMEQEPPAADVHYFLAWLEWAAGDTLAARARLQAAGIVPGHAPAPEVARAQAIAAAGDTLGAVAVLAPAVTRSALDPRIHALMADLLLARDPSHPHARIEAFAARALAPDDADAWLRWGLLQSHDRRHLEAIRSLERALALGRASPSREAEVRALLADLRRVVPGGDLVQSGLRHGP